MVISGEQALGFIMGPFGTLFLVLFIIYTGYKQLWVFGWYAKELRNRNDRLETRIDSLTRENRTVTSIAEKTAKIAEGRVEVTSE